MHKKLKIGVFLLFAVFLMFVLTGCGSASVHSKEGLGSGFFKQNTDGDYVVRHNSDATSYIDVNLVTFTILSSTSDDPDAPAADASMNAFHNVANTMYRCLFGESLASTGVYKGAETPESINLAPDVVAAEALEQTKNIISSTNVVDSVKTTIKSVAVYILVLIWMIEFIQSFAQDRFTMESLVKGFCFLIISILVVENADKFVTAMVETGNAIADKMVSSPAKIETELADYIADIEKGSCMYINVAFKIGKDVNGITLWLHFGSIFAIVLMALPIYAEAMCAYQILKVLINRMFHLIIGTTIAPIPLAFAAGRGLGPDGIRFLKALLVCALEPFGVLLVTKLVSSIVDIVPNIIGVSSAGVLGVLALTFSYSVISAAVQSVHQWINSYIS